MWEFSSEIREIFEGKVTYSSFLVLDGKFFFCPEVLMFPEKKFRSQTKLTFNVELI